MAEREHIAVVEDESDIREVIEFNLRREGFDVLSRANGEEGLRLIRQDAPDLVLLDIMLPGADGIEICRKLKTDPLTQQIPIIMVSAKGEESDVVLGLSMGADDYICKPFSPRELVARVRAVLRRGPIVADTSSKERIDVGGLVVDKSRHLVQIDGSAADFTATEFRLLYVLVAHPERVFTRDQLISRVIGERAIVSDRTIDAHVKAVRRKLGPYRDWVRTMRGVGYSFRMTN